MSTLRTPHMNLTQSIASILLYLYDFTFLFFTHIHSIDIATLTRANHLRPHASLMSTRKPSVPFFWERAPGVPRVDLRQDDELTITPPMRQSSRWRPYPNNHKSSNGGEVDNFSVASSDGSPSFIMKRFFSTTATLGTTRKYSKLRAPASHSRTDMMINTRSPSCGIMPILSWSLKSTLCGFKTPIRSQKRCKCFRSGIDEDFGGDELSTKACKSPGWGLPFLDSSRPLRVGEEDCDAEKAKGLTDVGVTSWSLPQLKPPSEPWLVNALSSLKRSRGPWL